jgi:CTP synthase
LLTASNIYEVPLVLDAAGLGHLVAQKLAMVVGEGDLAQWRGMVERMKTPREAIPIALVGKYVELRDSYISVQEALQHAALFYDAQVDIQWVHSEDLENDGGNIERLLGHAKGIVVPGGFGGRGIEGMTIAAQYAREHGVPYLGLCLGMHIMVMEYARNKCNCPGANSTEFVPDTPYPVIDLLPEQKDVQDKGGSMRLGAYPCSLMKNTVSEAAYDETVVHERHRHRFEFNNDFRYITEEAGLVAGGGSPDGSLVEIVELRDHPWMVGCQFHPEFRSRPNRPHPLFCGFIKKAKETLREGAQHSLPINAR